MVFSSTIFYAAEDYLSFLGVRWMLRSTNFHKQLIFITECDTIVIMSLIDIEAKYVQLIVIPIV